MPVAVYRGPYALRHGPHATTACGKSVWLLSLFGGDVADSTAVPSILPAVVAAAFERVSHQNKIS